jgi:putative FmdB family regulatory protein
VPTYAYACTVCDHRFDAVQSFSDDALTECPECAGRLRKVFGAVGIHFKGSGFYATDSKKSGSAAKAGSGGSGSSGTAGAGEPTGAGAAASAGGGSESGSGDGSSSAGAKGSSSGGAAPASTPVAAPASSSTAS